MTKNAAAWSSTYRDAPIAALLLSARAARTLQRRGISTVGELIACAPVDLRKLGGIGRRTIDEVKDRLADFGLQLSGPDGAREAPTVAMPAGIEFAVRRLHDLGRALEAAVTYEFPSLLAELEKARKGTPDALHVEAAVYAARLKKAEDRIAELEAIRRKLDIRHAVDESNVAMIGRVLEDVAAHLGLERQSIIEDPSIVLAGKRAEKVSR